MFDIDKGGETRRLLVALTTHERGVMAIKAAGLRRRIVARTEALKVHTQTEKAALKEVEAQAVELEEKASSGKEYRRVECRWFGRSRGNEPDVLIRIDTGETVDHRPRSKQQDLPLESEQTEPVDADAEVVDAEPVGLLDAHSPDDTSEASY